MSQKQINKLLQYNNIDKSLIDVGSYASDISFNEYFKNEYGLSLKNSSTKQQELIKNFEYVLNSNDLNLLYSFLNDLKQSNKNDYYFLINVFEDKLNKLQYIQLQIKNSKQKSKKVFKDNYDNINFIDISRFVVIGNINKVVNILRANMYLKKFYVNNKEYVFIFKNNSLIKISFNQLLNTYYISTNTTKQKQLTYFNLIKSYKYSSGIKRRQYVSNGKGYIRYFKGNYTTIKYSGFEDYKTQIANSI